MINYSLACDNGHEFDGWFRNSGDYDKQKELGLVTCPYCDSSAVQKRLMAPNVSTARSKVKAQAERQVAQAVAAVQAKATESANAPSQPKPTNDASISSEQPVARPATAVDLQKVPEKAKELVEALREFRKQVVSNSEYVGDKFAEEARKIHYGESEERGIYGETSPDDAQELIEEGIDLMQLPVLPEDRN
ncbi:hypothetical protein PsAD2_03433 [Pseudovibrio axinellae]|uniref:DUF1178 family protein n=1 Tax=Pseudovibrio axinellae TaxID=989403 RepID=A0A165WIF2_9HYPH|nr:DUF1178 family protein [Pseudovibrio axinellae]KZL16559.1 hypothetical protein PsAD2_03433 [Pseudovibrio axinellae]SEQ15807.1 hypothetical protein SAMN05421798_10213 [Pseudovibrio axinellae]